MSEQTQVTPEGIIQMGLGFWGSKTLLSAVGLGLFSVLAESGPLEGEDLRARLELHERSATDFFDALVALGMLERTAAATRTHPPPTCSSTVPSPPTPEASSRWRTPASTRSGRI